MESTLIAVDTAKSVFEVAESDAKGRSSRRLRLNREQFSQYLARRASAEFVLEACGGSHYWARVIERCGHRVRLLPVPYVCAYRRRNKTDRADCLALLEAAKNPEIVPVAVKSPEHQAIQGLHRCRSAWMETRTARINTLRGLLREFGIVLPPPPLNSFPRRWAITTCRRCFEALCRRCSTRSTTSKPASAPSRISCARSVARTRLSKTCSASPASACCRPRPCTPVPSMRTTFEADDTSHRGWA